jgi:hypothetical protein
LASLSSRFFFFFPKIFFEIFHFKDLDLFKFTTTASLAQSVEHGTFNLRVAGSSPAGGFLAGLAQLVAHLTVSSFLFEAHR